MMVADIPVLANTENVATVLLWVLIIDFHKVLINVLEPGLGDFKQALPSWKWMEWIATLVSLFVFVHSM